MKTEEGYILATVLIFLMVISMIVMEGTYNLLLTQQSQAAFKKHSILFLHVNDLLHHLILKQAVNGPSFISIDPTTQIIKKIIKRDVCTTTIDITIIVHDQNDQLMLNSRHIFAKVPRKLECRDVPMHRCIYFIES